ncbi:MAG: aminotransferase class V-fold PLP-dependent enzyme [Planctomycetes bacterium]|nr:aminotransferase class V-fold PLP-dependent enzyme [Planctomycetota bacterium]
MQALQNMRAAFPALDNGLCFLDWASTGLLPTPAHHALVEFLAACERCDSGESTWMHAAHGETRNALRTLLAQQLNAQARDIGLLENTTAGLNAAAGALRLQAGDNVILSEIDYLAVAMPWRHRARRDGLELRFVPPRAGRLCVDDLLERIDERTRVVALSTICWTSGALVDLAAIGRETRMRGIQLLVDATQTFGVTPLDTRAIPAQFIACGGHKWLLGTLGQGFLWVHPETAARHQPPFVGFLSGHPPQGHWGEWFSSSTSSLHDEVRVPSSARAFETGGTPNYAGAITLLASLRLLDSAGEGAIAAHVRSLGTMLIAGLLQRGYSVLTPVEPTERAGIVVFGAGGEVAEKALVQVLRTQRIVCSVRYAAGVGGIRISLHAPNTDADVQRLLAALPAQ